MTKLRGRENLSRWRDCNCHRRKSVPAPKNVAFNTISDDPRFPIFYLQLKERKISRASLFVRRWSYQVVTFSLLSSGMIVACTTQLRSSRYSRFAICVSILYTMQCSGSFSVGLKFQVIFARFTFHCKIKFEYRRKAASSRKYHNYCGSYISIRSKTHNYYVFFQLL